MCLMPLASVYSHASILTTLIPCDCKDTLFAGALEKGDVLILDGISIVKTCRWLCLVSLEYDDGKDFFLN